MRRGNFDLVHVHAGVGSPFAAAGVRVGLKLGLPVAVTVHCLPAAFRLPAFSPRGISPGDRRQVALNAVSGEAAAAPLRARTGATVSVVPNGLDPMTGRSERLITTRRCSRGVDHAAVGTKAAAAVAVRGAGGAAGTGPRLTVTLRLSIFGDGKLMPRMRRFITRHGMTETVRWRVGSIGSNLKDDLPDVRPVRRAGLSRVVRYRGLGGPLRRDCRCWRRAAPASPNSSPIAVRGCSPTATRDDSSTGGDFSRMQSCASADRRAQPDHRPADRLANPYELCALDTPL